MDPFNAVLPRIRRKALHNEMQAMQLQRRSTEEVPQNIGVI